MSRKQKRNQEITGFLYKRTEFMYNYMKVPREA